MTTGHASGHWKESSIDMIKFSEMTEEEIKKLYTVEKINKLDNQELVSLFSVTCNRAHRYNGSNTADHVAESLFWKQALDLVDAELCKRGLSVEYICITKNHEAESIIDLLNNPHFGLRALGVAEICGLKIMTEVEEKVSAISQDNPKLYGPFLVELRKMICAKSAILN